MAMGMSGGLFLFGSASSVVPFVFAADTGAGLAWAAALTALGLFAVGVVKSIVSKSGRVRAGLENLVIAGLGGIVAWWVGRLVNAGLG